MLSERRARARARARGYALEASEEEKRKKRTEGKVQKEREKEERESTSFPSFVFLNLDLDLLSLKLPKKQGIPPHLRPWVWSAASGALARRQEHDPHYYQAMVLMGEGHAAVKQTGGEEGGHPTSTSSPNSSKSAVGRQVDLDLPRTFPGNPRVELCLPSLRRVLLAFAAHAPEVGYCQSMNFIAALLLVATVVADDERFHKNDDDGEKSDNDKRRQNGNTTNTSSNGGEDNSDNSGGSFRRPFPQPPRAPTPREEETAFWLLVALADDSNNSSIIITKGTAAAASAAAAAKNKPRGVGGGVGGGILSISSSNNGPGSDDADSATNTINTNCCILPPGMYGRDLRGCRVELGALARLLRPRQPKLAKHVLDSLRCDASLLATEWFLCLFATSLPAETAVRVWDSLFVEGSKVLHRAALALLKRHSKGLLEAGNAGVAMRAARDGAAGEHDADGLLRTCFDGVGSLPMAKIEQARKETSQEVEREVAGRAARRAGGVGGGGRG